MATCSPEVVWTSLSLDAVVATPGLALLLYYISALLAVGAAISFVSVVGNALGASIVGSGVSLAICYSAYGVNGGNMENTFTRVSAGAWGEGKG